MAVFFNERTTRELHDSHIVVCCGCTDILEVNAQGMPINNKISTKLERRLFIIV